MEARRENFVLSGAAVWPLLASLATAATGPARHELEQAIGLPADGALAAATDMLNLIDRVIGVHRALGLWVRHNVPVYTAWTSALPGDTRGQLSGVPAEDQAALNAWVKTRTRGVLDQLPIQINQRTVLVLAACLAIRTAWQIPYDDPGGRWRPESGPWAGRPLHGLQAYSEDVDRVAVLDTRLGPVTIFDSYGADDVDVHLLIGAERHPPGVLLSETIAALTGSQAWRSGSELQTGETAPGLVVEEVTSYHPAPPSVHANIVAFDVSSTHDLSQSADLFGLRTAMDASYGHFPGISAWPLAVQQAKQTACATFSATGFEAAAATAVGLLLGAALRPSAQYTTRVIRLTFDRPFGFLAVDRLSRLVLFAGWLEHPAPYNPAESYGNIPENLA